MAKMVEEFDRMIGLPDWALTVEDKKEGLKLWQRKGEGSYSCVKMQGVIDQAPHDVMTVFTHNRKYRKQYDPNFDKSSQIERIADQMYLSYAQSATVSSKKVKSFNCCFRACISKRHSGCSESEIDA